MKVLLIQPPNPDPLMDRVYLFEPLALEYLGAGVRLDGHEVRLLDARLDPDVAGALRSYAPDVVGITGFTSHLNLMKGLAAQAKELAPGVRVVAGGHHATVQPEDFNDSAVDAVVIGEGVAALREILACWQSGAGIEDVRGLAVPTDGGLRRTAPRPVRPLDELPAPDRTLTAGRRGRYFSEWFRPLASVRTSLGCTARCHFCSLWALTGGKYLRRSPERIVEEIRGIAEPNIFFCDDESMCDVKRMDRLADLLLEGGIRKNYFLYARADTIVKHPELFGKWRRAGLSQVFVGMEDYSDERLARINKGISTSQQARAAKILADLGIQLYASFMVDPDYSREDFRRLKAYVRKLKLSYATFSVMTPLPGTELRARESSRLISHRPELCDMLHALVPTRLPLREFHEQMAELYAGAVPLYRALPALLRFGLHGALLRLRIYGRFLDAIRNAYLHYDAHEAA